MNGTTTSSRRGMLRLLGAAIAGGAATAFTQGRADATLGGTVILDTGNVATDSTGIEVDAGLLPYGWGVTDNGLGVMPVEAQYGAVFGHAKNSAFKYGVVGYADVDAPAGVNAVKDGGGTALNATALDGTGGVGVTATGGTFGVIGGSPTGVGAKFSGRYGALELQPTSAGTPPDDYRSAYDANVLEPDQKGGLWWSITPGPFAQWRQISGPDTGGAFHPLSPTRVFDSRVAAPRHAPIYTNVAVTISLKDGRDSKTGAITKPNVVPVHATAVACNITVVNTTQSGHLSINPGGDGSIVPISIAFFGGSTYTTGMIAKVNPANVQITVSSAGSGIRALTHLVIDVTGYWR